MTTLYDNLRDELFDGIDNAKLKGYIDESRAKWLEDRFEELLTEIEIEDIERQQEEDRELELRLEAEQDKKDFIEQELAYA